MPLAGRAPALSPSLRLVPDSVWAGVIEVLFALATVTVAMLPGITGAMSGRDQSAGFTGGSGPAPLALVVLVLAPLSIRIALVPGLLGQQRWARSLYLWSLPPVVLVTLILMARADGAPPAARLAGTTLYLGLTGLQAYLVLRSGTAPSASGTAWHN